MRILLGHASVPCFAIIVLAASMNLGNTQLLLD
jgi:hypothetical protein